MQCVVVFLDFVADCCYDGLTIYTGRRSPITVILYKGYVERWPYLVDDLVLEFMLQHPVRGTLGPSLTPTPLVLFLCAPLRG